MPIRGGLRESRPTMSCSQKRPLSIRIEGVKYAVPPLIRHLLTKIPSQRPTTLSAVSGGPVFPYCFFRKATPGGISAFFPAALHQPAALWGKRRRLLLPFTVLQKNLSKNYGICQDYSSFYRRSISSALFKVVSVILVPPMILASSFFRPSTSRGVTVV